MSIWWGCSGCESLVSPEGPGGRVPLSPTAVPGQRAQLGLSIPAMHAPLNTATHRDKGKFFHLALMVLPAFSMLLQRQQCQGIPCVYFSLLRLSSCSYPTGTNSGHPFLWSSVNSVYSMFPCRRLLQVAICPSCLSVYLSVLDCLACLSILDDPVS